MIAPRQDYGIPLGDAWNGRGIDGVGVLLGITGGGRRAARGPSTVNVQCHVMGAGSFFTLVLDLY